MLISRWSARARDSMRRNDLLEKKVFLAAYTLRKLMEAHKISSSFSERVLICESSPRASEQMHAWNNHKLDSLYHLGKVERRSLRLPNLLNMIIHSLAFNLVVEEAGEVFGFFVASDFQQERLWLVPIVEFCSTMRDAAEDYPTTEIRSFDAASKKWIIWTGHGEPPPHIRSKFDALAAAP